MAPRQTWLEPFSRDNAVEFLSLELGASRADELVMTLDKGRIPDLYGNPLSPGDEYSRFVGNENSLAGLSA